MHRKISQLTLAIAVVACLALQSAPSSRAAGPGTTLYLPLVSRLDPYKDWVSLGLPAGNPQPAGPAAVNYLYLAPTCDDVQPTSILAGTDRGLYSYGAGWSLNAGLGSAIQVSHIFSPAPGELLVASFNQGLWRSANGGTTWARESIPNSDLRVYWVASGGPYLYAAASKGLYRRPSAGGAWSSILAGAIYSVAVDGTNVYAAQIGSTKDTLFISSDGGDSWPVARQIPGGVNFVQTLAGPAGGAQLLIGAVSGGLYTLDGTNAIVPFSQGISLTVYGIWRDAQARVYAALEAPGGLRRLPAAGGASDLDLSALPGGSLTSQTLYTVSGSAACSIIATGTEGGGVWMRRLP